MARIGAKIYCDDTTGSMMFECPGCGSIHALNVTHEQRPRWTFNGDGDRPTFTPSILARWTRSDPPVTSETLNRWKTDPWPQTKVNQVCHSFVTDGRIQFLSDCTHALAGQTVNMPDWE